jgi:hypothetical protein
MELKESDINIAHRLFSWDFFFLLGIDQEEHIDAAVVISGVEDGTYLKHLASKMFYYTKHQNPKNN